MKRSCSVVSKTFSPYKEFGIDKEVRVVVYDLISKTYILKQVIGVGEEYTMKVDSSYSKDNLKFKYQIYEESRWKDVLGGNRYIFTVDSKVLLKNIDFTKNSKINILSLGNAKEAQLSYALKYMLKNIYEYLFSAPNTVKIKKTEEFLNLFNEELMLHSDIISHFHSQLTILVKYIDYCENHKSINELTSCLQLLKKLTNKYKFNYLENDGISSGKSVARGNILSVYDRDLAYENYQKAISIGESYISGFLAVDAMTTYYAKIDDHNNSYFIEEYEGNHANRNLNVCFSTDASYFKMFAFIWVQASFSFKDLNFNFGIVAESKELFNEMVGNYELLVDVYSKFLGSSAPKNNNFFWICPAFINKTVFACARFYLSSLLLEKHSNDVYISDIDQLVIGDLETYLINISKQVSNSSVYLPIVSKYYNFLPGRSHLAGNIYIRNDDQGKKFSNLLTNYVGMGIEEPYSWMLDQNATRYASEIIPVGDIRVHGRRVLKQYPEFKVALRKTS